MTVPLTKIELVKCFKGTKQHQQFSPWSAARPACRSERGMGSTGRSHQAGAPRSRRFPLWAWRGWGLGRAPSPSRKPSPPTGPRDSWSGSGKSIKRRQFSRHLTVTCSLTFCTNILRTKECHLQIFCPADQARLQAQRDPNWRRSLLFWQNKMWPLEPDLGRPPGGYTAAWQNKTFFKKKKKYNTRGRMVIMCESTS